MTANQSTIETSPTVEMLVLLNRKDTNEKVIAIQVSQTIISYQVNYLEKIKTTLKLMKEVSKFKNTDGEQSDQDIP